ncbi:MAG: tRNA uridine-5-carboxymethylaminomethyl(34) synthesis GTPase MnmE [Acutalibacteraceae bacterium]|nr:tRNA uridine-5-carboxymethylaminomethyl(34) synthesis GTPase MnmE [Acutalibacteraceae bacterium]
MAEKTIAAISTPAGQGGIGVIRISGEEAITVADRVFKAISGKKLCSLSGYTALFGHIYDGEELIDEAVATVFLAPKSYTGENVCELSCHGGQYVTATVLRACLSAGATLAAAGEFTKRAFLNGKLDLIEAESVMGLISAGSRQELQLQLTAKQGATGRAIEKIEAALLELSADFAAYSDYPDEDLPDLAPENFLRLLTSAREGLSALLSTFDAGKVIREGLKTAIIGKPNVGKSTLMNMLSGEKRSIVTDIAGTTRDVVENTVSFGGLTLILADTAGIRSTDDPVEGVGVDLAKERIASSQLVLALFDGSAQSDADDSDILSLLSPENTVIILNKSDKGQTLSEGDFRGFRVVTLSAKEGHGAEELKSAITEIAGTAELDPSAAVILSERQRDLAQKALSAVCEAENLLSAGYTIDAVSVCVDEALSVLYTIDGKRVTNEVADEVFRRFCVGK